MFFQGKGMQFYILSFLKRMNCIETLFVVVLNFKHLVLIITQGRVWLNIWWFMIHNKVLSFHNWNLLLGTFSW